MAVQFLTDDEIVSVCSVEGKAVVISPATDPITASYEEYREVCVRSARAIKPLNLCKVG